MKVVPENMFHLPHVGSVFSSYQIREIFLCMRGATIAFSGCVT